MSETEHALQKRIIKWARSTTGIYPELGRLHMVNNEALVSYVPRARQMAFRQHLRSLGMISGVSDLFLPALRVDGHQVKGGLYLELKRPGVKDLGKALTKHQEDWLTALRHDYACYASSSFDGAIHTITSYLNYPHPREVFNEQHCIR